MPAKKTPAKRMTKKEVVPQGFIYRDANGKVRFNSERAPFLTMIGTLFLILAVMSTGIALIVRQGESNVIQTNLNKELIRRIGERFEENATILHTEHAQIISYIKCVLLLPPDQFRNLQGKERSDKLQEALDNCERDVFPRPESTPTPAPDQTARPQATATRSPPRATARATPRPNPRPTARPTPPEHP